MKITCKLDDIRIDGGTQPRTSVNDSVVSEYAEAMMAGATFPPIVCVWDGVGRFVVDGFHRLHAYRQAGVLEVEVEQHTGTLREAILMSVGMNAHHGLRRTNDDKRRAVRMLLEDAEWGQWSDREIARQTATSAPFVAKLRDEVSVNVGRSGASVNVGTPEPSVNVDRSEDTRTVKRGEQTYQQRVGDRKRAEPESAHDNAADEDDDSPSVDQLLAEMQEDLRRAEARVAELETLLKDQGKDAIVAMSQRLDHAERRQAELMDEAMRAKARADRYERTLARIGKAVGDKDLDQVAPRVEALVRKLRDSKVAA